MKLIVGLGNPGKIYQNSRHNVGFSTVELFAKIYNIHLKKDKISLALKGEGRIERQRIILALPLTFMNLSGLAVEKLMKEYKIDLASLLVVCDDLDLELGRIKIKPSGSSAGHRGLESIINMLGTKNFARLRIGIGRPLNNQHEITSYVLSKFNKNEKKKIETALDQAIECCRVWVTEGINKSMNIFNRRN